MGCDIGPLGEAVRAMSFRHTMVTFSISVHPARNGVQEPNLKKGSAPLCFNVMIIQRLLKGERRQHSGDGIARPPIKLCTIHVPSQL